MGFAENNFAAINFKSMKKQTNPKSLLPLLSNKNSSQLKARIGGPIHA